ncbi:hypothetical protein P692DRAFT_201728775, partial [Suillus brevipes Sb2]
FQCAVPVFEGLLLDPLHDGIIMDLLFDLATWQGYAKLRLHTEDTLDFFDTATAVLGNTVRRFKRTTCEHYRTTELPQEHAARGHRLANLAAKQVTSANKTVSASHPKVKHLNLGTYKFHALGHYPATIRMRGTTDNYSTQPVSLFFAF